MTWECTPSSIKGLACLRNSLASSTTLVVPSPTSASCDFAISVRVRAAGCTMSSRFMMVAPSLEMVAALFQPHQREGKEKEKKGKEKEKNTRTVGFECDRFRAVTSLSLSLLLSLLSSCSCSSPSTASFPTHTPPPSPFPSFPLHAHVSPSLLFSFTLS